MLLRPRQKLFVERCVAALRERDNTLGVAPTGAGKTYALSAIIGQLIGNTQAKACVLAHRDELTAQNREKFGRVNPQISTSVVDASDKSWDGQTVFAMVPTLAREGNLRRMPALDHLVIDEAHHAVADTYQRVIDAARAKNPDLRLLGVTATPNRGDKRGLRPVFDNVADQIMLAELIRSGHLVPPRTFVIDLGVQDELREVRRTAQDFDMAAVDAIMNSAPLTDAVIRHWRERAADRQTVVFCSSVSHAANVRDAFRADGIAAVMVHGDMSLTERREVLRQYGTGEAQVITNVAVLTEGWDHPPTSCVVLLRPSSFKSTLIQMVGRGLRTVNPAEFPGVVKTDCIVLDFGISTLLHGSLEQAVDLDGQEGTGPAPIKTCPECGGEVPIAVQECPLCGYVWETLEEGSDPSILDDFIMSEIDLLKRSNFEWCDLFGDDAALIANGFTAWGGIFFFGDRWHALGGGKGLPARLLSVGERTVCLAAADDWLNENESDDSAHKTRRWINEAATEAQLQYLPPEFRFDHSLTRYQASAMLTFRFNRKAIQRAVFDATPPEDRRAA